MPNECNDLLPSMCGRSRLPTFSDSACEQVHFTGITDTTIYVGDTIDLEQGIHAYDGNGNEIVYAYTPTSIDTSVAGEYVVTYTASGSGTALMPSMCGDMALHTINCGNETAVEYRTITVLSKDAVVCEAIVCESPIGC